tara:strand:- start:2371 stop:2811 length:441 start_codon:yes stop_codon:yes gene_type:complete
VSRVDFYILSEGNNVDRFACAIATKAWASGNRVHIHTQSDENATKFDDLLWIYKDISFVPHEIFNGNTHDDTPVTIGYGGHFPKSSQVMINLGPDIPEFTSSFDRVVEIVGGTESNKQLARQRYRQYKEAEYEIHDHKIENLTEHD